MFENFDFDIIAANFVVWLNTHILSASFALQISVVLIAAAIALIARRVLRPRLQDMINGLKINFRLAEILRRMVKLCWPFIALVIVLLGSNILSVFALDISLTRAVAKLLLAWIGIRLVVQFIGNSFARQSAAMVIWGIAALSIFGVLDETSAALDSLGIDLGDFRLSALTIVKGVLALAALIYIATILANVTDRQINRISSLSPSSRVLLTKIARVFLIVAALLIGITTAGIDLSLLAVFSGAVGLGVGFGLQKGISNLFSGMMLLLDESIKPGDIIELPGADGTTATFGWVNHMGARYTEIVTRDNKSFLVPNEDFITQQVVNWSHGNTLVRMKTDFGVHYDSDPHMVKRIAEEAAATVERVVDTPAPVCWLIEFGDSSLNFTLRYWIKDAEKGVTNCRGQVMMALWDAFKANDIQIPYPHREVFIHQDNQIKPETGAVKKPQKSKDKNTDS